MATKETVPGLLSKVAKFVRNPTKDWSDLDNLDSTPESGYDKQALKEMIERKRQNDFVRRREFDQLRKLRSKEGTGVGGLARSSVFQSSVTTDQDGRAVTLKKIDEIEAQMSKQWWKGKQDTGMPGATGAPSAPSATQSPDSVRPAADQSTKPAQDSSGHFTSTRPSGADYNASEQVDTEMGMGASRIQPPVAPMGRRATDQATVMNPFADRHGGADVGFSTSKLFAMEIDAMATDPELEEAAIRFANGDDVGAENSLLQALRGPALVPEVALSWAAALLDLYRATHQRDKFDQAVLEFAMRFGAATPMWERAPAPLHPDDHLAAMQMADTVPRGADSPAGHDAIWDSPTELTLAAMEQLREAMSSHPMPWHLGWTHLQSISPDAMPLLAGLFSSLCDEPVELRFSGAQNLAQTLRKMMPSGDRSVDVQWWAVRLNALRTMQLLDEFELVALDYCVTYEVSPPAWTAARCSFENVVTSGPVFAQTVPASMNSGFGQAATTPMVLDAKPGNTLTLAGEVLGDATPALTATGGPYRAGDRVIISCVQLVRVDFSAAGSILNWVAVRQSEGCQVQFRDVHRLVAAFFSVIGINEHAHIVPKAI